MVTRIYIQIHLTPHTHGRSFSCQVPEFRREGTEKGGTRPDSVHVAQAFLGRGYQKSMIPDGNGLGSITVPKGQGKAGQGPVEGWRGCIGVSGFELETFTDVCVYVLEYPF